MTFTFFYTMKMFLHDFNFCIQHVTGGFVESLIFFNAERETLVYV